jgi:hypothetical protein
MTAGRGPGNITGSGNLAQVCTMTPSASLTSLYSIEAQAFLKAKRAIMRTMFFTSDPFE